MLLAQLRQSMCTVRTCGAFPTVQQGKEAKRDENDGDYWISHTSCETHVRTENCLP